MGDAEHPGAALLSASAHDLRNHVATIRSVVRLVDDEEVADALDEASRALQLAIERAVVLSRMELGAVPDVVQLPSMDLAALGVRRAQREGSDVTDATGSSDVIHQVPGPWAERLVADLVHRSGSAPAIGDDGVIAFVADESIDDELDAALDYMASRCGATLDRGDEFLAVSFPRLSEG